MGIPNRKTSLTFLSIPLELRRQIYHDCHAHSSPYYTNYISIDGSGFPSQGYEDEAKNLLLVCKQIYHEAIDILYSANTFRIHLARPGAYNIENLISDENVQYVKKIQLIIEPGNVLSRNSMDTKFWKIVLPRLTELLIVIQQPLRPGRFERNIDFEEDLTDWENWVGRILKVVGRVLGSDCYIEVDVRDEHADSKSLALIEMYLSGRYVGSRTAVREHCFKRELAFLETGSVEAMR